MDNTGRIGVAIGCVVLLTSIGYAQRAQSTLEVGDKVERREQDLQQAVATNPAALAVKGKSPLWIGSLSGSVLDERRTDLEGDAGSVGARRESVSAGVDVPLAKTTMAGISVEREWSQYDFSGTVPGTEESALDYVSVTRYSTSVRHTLSPDWSMFALASMAVSAESGAAWRDALTYGGLVSVRRRVSERLAFSLGFMMNTRLDDDPQPMPVPGIEWQITDRLSLRTAQGVTLGYDLMGDKKWTAEFNAGYENRTYRLDGDNPRPNGILKDRRVPVGVGLRYQPSLALYVRAFGGMAVRRSFRFADENGDNGETLNADATPGGGLAAGVKF